jgi:hypothetical protein
MQFQQWVAPTECGILLASEATPTAWLALWLDLKRKTPRDRLEPGQPDKSKWKIAKHRKQAERGGFEPPRPVAQSNGLANRRYRPLSHLSGNLAGWQGFGEIHPHRKLPDWPRSRQLRGGETRATAGPGLATNRDGGVGDPRRTADCPLRSISYESPGDPRPGRPRGRLRSRWGGRGWSGRCLRRCRRTPSW